MLMLMQESFKLEIQFLPGILGKEINGFLPQSQPGWVWCPTELRWNILGYYGRGTWIRSVPGSTQAVVSVVTPATELT